MKLARLDFVVRPHTALPDIHEIMPRINGGELATLVQNFEQTHEMEKAGATSYGGLIPAYWRGLRSRLAQHFWGATKPDTTNGEVVLLGCGDCGEWGCWPLLANVTLSDDLVLWDGFQQPHREGRDYTDFGPFRFDRRAYEHACRQLEHTYFLAEPDVDNLVTI